MVDICLPAPTEVAATACGGGIEKCFQKRLDGAFGFARLKNGSDPDIATLHKKSIITHQTVVSAIFQTENRRRDTGDDVAEGFILVLKYIIQLLIIALGPVICLPLETSISCTEMRTY